MIWDKHASLPGQAPTRPFPVHVFSLNLNLNMEPRTPACRRAFWSPSLVAFSMASFRRKTRTRRKRGRVDHPGGCPPLTRLLRALRPAAWGLPQCPASPPKLISVRQRTLPGTESGAPAAGGGPGGSQGSEVQLPAVWQLNAQRARSLPAARAQPAPCAAGRRRARHLRREARRGLEAAEPFGCVVKMRMHGGLKNRGSSMTIFRHRMAYAHDIDEFTCMLVVMFTSSSVV